LTNDILKGINTGHRRFVMARPLRIEYPGAFYHITSRGNDRRRIFQSKNDYELFKGILEEAKTKYGIQLHAYALMINHYHLLMETPNGNLSKVMHYVNGTYTNIFNRKRKRSGHLLQGRYKAILVERDSYLLELSRYLHLNPVRAKIVDSPQAYPYSSYTEYTSNKNDGLVTKDLILKMMSGNPKEATGKYRAFVESGMTHDSGSPLNEVYAGSILGGEGFIREALSRLKDGALDKEETAHRRELASFLSADDILDAVSSEFQTRQDGVVGEKGLPRNVAIYLIKKYTDMTNREIGNMFGGLTFTAVTKVKERLQKRLTRDKALKNTLNKIETGLSDAAG
jgi:REP element-mobilizing transposase RayT